MTEKSPIDLIHQKIDERMKQMTELWQQTSIKLLYEITHRFQMFLTDPVGDYDRAMSILKKDVM